MTTRGVLSGAEATAVLDRQTEVMELMGADAALHEVLGRIVAALEALMPASACSVLLLDETGLLRTAAAPSLPAAYSAAIDGLAPGPAAGSCGTAVHVGAPVVAFDVAVDPRWRDFRELAARHGLRSCWSSPIFCHGRVHGTFAVYHGDTYEPDDHDAELVRRFTHLASVAVSHDHAARERDARHAADLARESAERANLAKSQFVTAVSHELRTPLQSVLGFTEHLQTLDLSAERRREALDRIDAAARHILAIVNDVLDLARVEAGALPIEVGRVDVAAEVAACVAIVEPLAARRGVVLTCEAAALTARADGRRLRQVVLNLLSNAVRFSPPGGEVAVRADCCEGSVRVHVVDHGPGIPADLMARLFVPFDRLGAEAGREGGAGLGLVLARRLAEAMGGSLDVASVVGEGTRAWVTLPAVPADAG